MALDNHQRMSLVLRSAARWLVLLAIPCGVVFCETWLHLQVLNGAYESAELRTRTKELRERINTLKLREAELESTPRMNAKAPELFLITPAPGQIHVLAERSCSELLPENERLLAKAAASGVSRKRSTRTARR